MRPKVKYTVIYHHRSEYPVSVMCRFFEVSRSGYYGFVKRLGQRENDVDLAEKIQECQNKTDKTYGYRRVWKWLQDRDIKKNPKTVLRVMKKYGLLSEIRRRRKWVNLGQHVQGEAEQHNAEHRNGQNGNGDGENNGAGGVYDVGHDHRAKHDEGRAQNQAQCQVDARLYLTDVARHTGDHRRAAHAVKVAVG